MEITSIENYKAPVEDMSDRITTVDWNGVKVNIKKVISFAEMISLVEAVVSTCFEAEDGEYTPELEDFVIKSYIIHFYSDVALPTDVADRYDLIYSTNLIDIIMGNIDDIQLSAILESIDKKIEYRVKSNITVINKQIEKIINTFTALNDLAAATPNSVDNNLLIDIYKMITQKGYDVSGLAKAMHRDE